ncbi:MAG: cytidylate kinase-like family protein [Verrucomicrobia bacterium]|jgi:cytidylate kinase|nr:cytidylate kinase-like family protein [Verrucomicrobiota bacterium]
MHTGIGYEQCLSFINCEISPAKPVRGKRTAPSRFRALTLSRLAGSGAHAIAEQLAGRLQAKAVPGQRPWTVFDRELVTRVLEDHHLPARMAEFIPEDRRTELQDAVEEFFGLRPPSWTLIQHTTETILHLVELGNVILIGRAANLVIRNRPDVLHVRLVGSEETRAARLAAARKLTRKAALEVLRREDRGRTRYVKKYFGADIDDPLHYSATFNTDLLSLERVADALSELMLSGPGEPQA